MPFVLQADTTPGTASFVDVATSAATLPITNFIYQPGGVAAGRLYTTTASLREAMAEVSGPKNLYLDASLGAITLDAGTYGDTETSIFGISAARVDVTVEEGAVVPATNWTGLNITWEGTSAVRRVEGDGVINFNRVTLTRDAAAFGPFFQCDGATTLVMDDSTIATSDPADDVIDIGVQALNVRLLGGSVLSEGVITGTAGVFVATGQDTSSVTEAQAPGGLSLSALSIYSAGGLVTAVAAAAREGRYVMGTGNDLTLPPATSAPLGCRILVVQQGGGAVSVIPNGADTINGVNASITVGGDLAAVELFLVGDLFGGRDWIIISRSP